MFLHRLDVQTQRKRQCLPGPTLRAPHYSGCTMDPPATAPVLAVLLSPQLRQAELHLVAIGGLGLARLRHASSCYLQHAHSCFRWLNCCCNVTWNPSTCHHDCQTATGYNHWRRKATLSLLCQPVCAAMLSLWTQVCDDNNACQAKQQTVDSIRATVVGARKQDDKSYLP